MVFKFFLVFGFLAVGSLGFTLGLFLADLSLYKVRLARQMTDLLIFLLVSKVTCDPLGGS